MKTTGRSQRVLLPCWWEGRAAVAAGLLHTLHQHGLQELEPLFWVVVAMVQVVPALALRLRQQLKQAPALGTLRLATALRRRCGMGTGCCRCYMSTRSSLSLIGQ